MGILWVGFGVQVVGRRVRREKVITSLELGFRAGPCYGGAFYGIGMGIDILGMIMVRNGIQHIAQQKDYSILLEFDSSKLGKTKCRFLRS